MMRSIISELRSQRAVIIERENGDKIVVLPAEFLRDKIELPAGSKLLISDMRAEALGIKTTAKAVSFSADNLSLAEVNDLIGICSHLTNLPQHNDEDDTGFLLDIMKKAGLLPAVIISSLRMNKCENLEFLEKKLQQQLANKSTKIFETARANLPLENAENTVLVSFAVQGDDVVHLTLLIGDIKNVAQPLVRVHSSCVTGDLLGSLRCDCGNQLQLALDAIKNEGCGVLLYLNQEGRGIGITNKLRAYNLQQQGVDTFSANRSLGFYDDERDFLAASLILKELKIESIRLLSNNPHKVSALQQYGIKVSERLPLVAPSGEHSHSYIKAKVDKAGHIF